MIGSEGFIGVIGDFRVVIEGLNCGDFRVGIEGLNCGDF